MKSFREFCDLLTETHHNSEFGAAAAMPEPARRIQLQKAISELDTISARLAELLFHQNPKLSKDVAMHLATVLTDIKQAISGPTEQPAGGFRDMHPMLRGAPAIG